MQLLYGKTGERSWNGQAGRKGRNHHWRRKRHRQGHHQEVCGEGARVCMVDLRREALEASAEELGLPEGSYVIAPADITDESLVQEAVKT